MKGLWAKWRAWRMPPIVAVWYGVVVGLLGGWLGNGLLDGRWGFSAHGWSMFIGGGILLGLLGTAGTLLLERRKRQKQPPPATTSAVPTWKDSRGSSQPG